jgi:DNA-binding MarR family transcriptional regulator
MMVAELDFIRHLQTDISKIVRLQRAYFQRQRQRLPLPPSLASLLATIDSFGPSSPTRLADLEGVRVPPISRAIASLEKQGLVRREPDPNDGRRTLIHLTAPGRETLAATRSRTREWMVAQFSRLDEDDIDAIRRASDAIHRLADSGDSGVESGMRPQSFPDAGSAPRKSGAKRSQPKGAL